MVRRLEVTLEHSASPRLARQGAGRDPSAGRRGNRSFNRDAVLLAEDLARRAASAIETAQLHRAVLDQESRFPGWRMPRRCAWARMELGHIVNQRHDAGPTSSASCSG